MSLGKRKAIWLTTVVAAVTVLAAVWFWPNEPAQIVTLGDGHQYQFVGVTWGTNHSQPRMLARVVDSLPPKLAAYARAKLNPRFALDPPTSTSKPALLVWLKLVGTNTSAQNPGSPQYPFLATTLADEHGFRSGYPSAFVPYKEYTWRPDTGFVAVPRRSRVLEYDLFDRDQNSNVNAKLAARFHFANPLFGHFPQWQPETLPAVKSDGGLRVHLNSFSVQWPAGPYYNSGTSFSLSFEMPPGASETWGVDHVALSDATGNCLEVSHPYAQSGGTYSMNGTLWPNETAWRLRVALKRTNGIPAGDLITFSNLPILTAALPNWGKVSRMTNLSRGSPVVIQNFYPFGGSSWVRDGYWVDLDPSLRESPALAVDIVNVTTDAGDPTPLNGRGMDWQFNTVPTGAKTYTVIVAAQKPLVVEFLVKPPDMSTN